MINIFKHIASNQSQWGRDAMRILKFVEGMKEKAIKGLLEVSGIGKLKEKTHTFKGGSAYLSIIRGGSN
jgi:hypothetical protein